jgi:hypothetical protein
MSRGVNPAYSLRGSRSGEWDGYPAVSAPPRMPSHAALPPSLTDSPMSDGGESEYGDEDDEDEDMGFGLFD